MRRAVLAAFAVVAALLSAALLWQHLSKKRQAPAEFYAYAAADRSLPKLWAAPPFSYPDQQGREVTPATLRGRPWIADFIYTECTSACPMMTSRMVLIQRALAGVDVRFVSFSVDPQHDTPQVLAAYAHTWNRSETRWSLLATDPAHLQDTLVGFRVSAERTQDPASPIVHSSVFLLVDADGWVRGVYDSTDDGARSRLVADARRVVGQGSAVAAGQDGQGGDLYASMGCAGCHANPQLAPRLDDLSGAQVTLDDGTKVTADDEYMRQSILDPAARIVAGYPAIMPSYEGELSDTQLAQLVREVDGMKSAAPAATPSQTAPSQTAPSLAKEASGPAKAKTLAVAGRPGSARTGVVAASASASPPAAAPVAEEPAKIVTDPVCTMSVRVTPDTVHTTYQGHEVYFCSERCRDAFLANPAKYYGSPGSNTR